MTTLVRMAETSMKINGFYIFTVSLMRMMKLSHMSKLCSLMRGWLRMMSLCITLDTSFSITRRALHLMLKSKNWRLTCLVCSNNSCPNNSKWKYTSNGMRLMSLMKCFSMNLMISRCSLRCMNFNNNATMMDVYNCMSKRLS